MKPGNQEAYDLYLQGRFFFNKRGAGLVKGLECFKQSVALDSTFALSHEGIGYSYALLAYYHMIPSLNGIQEAKKSAMKVLQLNPGSADAFTILGFVALWNERDWNKSKQMLQKAIQLNPNSAFAHTTYGTHLHFVEGNFSEAAAEARMATQLDPFWFVPYNVLGSAMVGISHTEAMEAYQKSLELNSNSSLPYNGIAELLLLMKKPEEAIKTLENGMNITGRTQMMLVTLCEVYAESGNKEAALRIYHELNDKSHREYIAPYTLARVALSVGKLDEAFSLFDKAFEQKNYGFTILKYPTFGDTKSWSGFRKDPRYQSLMDRLAFP